MTSKPRSHGSTPSRSLTRSNSQGRVFLPCSIAFAVLAASLGTPGDIESSRCNTASLLDWAMQGGGFGMYGMMALGGLILYGITASAAKAPGRKLQSKFQRLGVLQGRARSEIEAAVGTPNAISGMPNGRMLCQWRATGYHICLVFTDGTCDGISNEISV